MVRRPYFSRFFSLKTLYNFELLTRKEFYYTKIFTTSFYRCVGSFIQIGSTNYFLHAFKCVILCKIRKSVKIQTLNARKKKLGVTIIDIFSSSLVILMSYEYYCNKFSVLYIQRLKFYEAKTHKKREISNIFKVL